MAMGDRITIAPQSLTNTTTVDIRPPAGNEWVIHNLLWEIPTNGKIEIYKVSASATLLFDSDTSSGGKLGFMFHCTNDVWYRLRNASATIIKVSYDGVQSK